MPTDAELRDRLALDRTLLANERTLLAYVRTALALLAAGASVVQFIQAAWAGIWGPVLIGLGVVTLPLGVLRYLSVRRHLRDAGTTPDV